MFAAYRLGQRLSARHALVAMAVMAIWYESVYFSVHALTEPLAVAAFLSAAAILEPDSARRRLIVGGALLMLAAIFRIQYAPAIAAYTLFVYGKNPRTWLWLAAGGLAVALVSSGIDLAMGQWPFGWVWANVQQNVIADKASGFGVGAGNVSADAVATLASRDRADPVVRGCRRAAISGAGRSALGRSRAAPGDRPQGISLHPADRTDHDPARRDRIGRRRRSLADPACIAARDAGRAIVGWTASSAALAASSSADPGLATVRKRQPTHPYRRPAPVVRTRLIDESYWLTIQTYARGIPLYYVKGRDAASERKQLADSDRAYDAIIAVPGRATIPTAYNQIECRGDGAQRLCLSVRSGGCTHDALSIPG